MIGFSQRYAIRLLLSMSMEDAKAVLGFPPGASPSPGEIQKAYKRKAIENHPDRGGDHRKMVEVNVAKEILEGKRREDRTPYTPPKPPKKTPEEEAREYREKKLKEALKALNEEQVDVAGYLKFAFMRSAPDLTFGGMNLDLKEFLTDDFASALDKISDEIDANRPKEKGLKVYEAMSRDFDLDIQAVFKRCPDPNKKVVDQTPESIQDILKCGKICRSLVEWWKAHKPDIIPLSDLQFLKQQLREPEARNSMWDAMKSELEKLAPEVNDDWLTAGKLCQSLTSKALRLASKFGALKKRRDFLMSLTRFNAGDEGVTLDEMGALVKDTAKFVTDWNALYIESGKLQSLINTSEGMPSAWDAVYSRSHQIVLQVKTDLKGVTDSDFKDFEKQLKESIKVVDRILGDFGEKAPSEKDWRTPGDYQWAMKVIQLKNAGAKNARTADVEPTKEPKTRKPRKKHTRDTVLLRIEKGEYHFLPFDEVKAAERPIIKELVSDGLIKLMEPKGKFPERYVVTSKGSHAIRTFNAKLIALAAQLTSASIEERVASRYRNRDVDLNLVDRETAVEILLDDMVTARVARRYKAATKLNLDKPDDVVELLIDATDAMGGSHNLGAGDILEPLEKKMLEESVETDSFIKRVILDLYEDTSALFSKNDQLLNDEGDDQGWSRKTMAEAKKLEAEIERKVKKLYEGLQ